MWDKIIELIKANENELFVALSLVILAIIGFLIKRYFFKDKPSENLITLEQYKKDLKKLKEKITKKLTKAS